MRKIVVISSIGFKGGIQRDETQEIALLLFEALIRDFTAYVKHATVYMQDVKEKPYCDQIAAMAILTAFAIQQL
ncbi:MAG: hypothetical protein QXU18_11905 [Thermoplasmatales archaeon]